MKNGLKILCTLLLLVGFIRHPTIQAMDNDKNVQQLQIVDLPDDVLLLILSFVVAQDPNAVGNLLQIQTISKRFKGMLTDQQMKWIAGLTQEKLNTLLTDAVNNLDAKKVELWIRFGARITPSNGADLLRGLFQQVVNNMGLSTFARMKYAEDNMLEITKMIFDLGGTEMNDQDGMDYIMFAASQLDWENTLKYLLEHKVPVIVKGYYEGFWIGHMWNNAVAKDNVKIVQLLLNYGANPNFGETPSGMHPPLYYVKSAQMARILLDGGAQLYVDCQSGARKPGSQSPTFSDIVRQAIRAKSPSMIIDVLKKNYSLETATAIALALMAGASLAGMTCTIL